MKLITFLAEAGVIHNRTVIDYPEQKLVKTDKFEVGYFYLSHNNGVDYIQMDQNELMAFIRTTYCLAGFDLINGEDMIDILNFGCSIYYGMNLNNTYELRPFKYGDRVINQIDDLFVCFEDGLFKDGFNINRVIGL